MAKVSFAYSTAAAKSLQSCQTLCDPIDGSPLGSPVPGILQAITLEWVAISFSNAWKWKVIVKSLSHVRLLAIPWTAAHGIFQARVLEWGAIVFWKQSRVFPVSGCTFFLMVRFAALRLIVDEDMRVGDRRVTRAGNKVSTDPLQVLASQVYQDRVGPRRCVHPLSL